MSFADWLINRAQRRAPDVYIGGKVNPYLLRWYVTPWSRLYRRKSWADLKWWQKIIRALPNVYLHQMLRDDDDRDLHDHPWWNMSIVLRGGYFEYMPWMKSEPGGVALPTRRYAGDIILRRPTDFHRLELPDAEQINMGPNYDGPAIWRAAQSWSLFITGPKVREWGFACPNGRGWVHWEDFTGFRTTGDSTTVGPGCD